MQAAGRSGAAADWMDRAAVAASLACMVHCLALPLVVAALPALSSVLDVPESFHLWVLGFAAPVAAVALLQGRVRHGAWWPVGLGAAGLTLLAAGALLLPEGAVETAATVAGGMILGGAQIANWRLRRACAC